MSSCGCECKGVNYAEHLIRGGTPLSSVLVSVPGAPRVPKTVDSKRRVFRLGRDLTVVADLPIPIEVKMHKLGVVHETTPVIVLGAQTYADTFPSAMGLDLATNLR